MIMNGYHGMTKLLKRKGEPLGFFCGLKNNWYRPFNMSLSLSRAVSVRSYLVGRGVPEDRLTAKGYGPDEPVASNETPEGRAQNRRVELRRLN